MSALSKLQETSIQQVISSVLSEARPEEVFLVEHLFKPTVNAAKRTEALGFGVDVGVVLWMYPLMEVLKELAGTAANEFAKKWGDHLDDWLRHKSGPEHVLNPDALAKLRSRVVEKLLSAGAAQRQANLAGDSLVAMLAEEPSLIRNIVEAK
jgi:hypothetical protein